MGTEAFVQGISGSKDNIIVSQVVPPPTAVNIPWVQRYAVELHLFMLMMPRSYQASIQKSSYPRQYTFASLEGYLVGKLVYHIFPMILLMLGLIFD